MQPTLIRNVLFAVVPLLAIVSTVIVALSESSLKFISNNMGEEFFLDAAGTDHYILGALPLNFDYSVVKFSVVTGFFSGTINLGFLIFMLRTVMDDLRNYKFSRHCMYTMLLVINAILILSLLITVNVIHVNSAHFDIRYTSKYGGYGPSDIYDKGTFDLETWTCELNNVLVIAEEEQGNMGDDIGKQCRIERASRWMTVPLLVLAATVAVLAVWELVRVERARRAEELEEQELYGISHT